MQAPLAFLQHCMLHTTQVQQSKPYITQVLATQAGTNSSKNKHNVHWYSPSIFTVLKLLRQSCKHLDVNVVLRLVEGQAKCSKVLNIRLLLQLIGTFQFLARFPHNPILYNYGTIL